MPTYGSPMNPKLRSTLMLVAKIAAVVGPAIGSGVAVNAKSTAETGAGYRALRAEVEAQAKELAELRADVRELRAALLARVLGSATPPYSGANSPPLAAKLPPISLPAPTVAARPTFGSGAKLELDMVVPTKAKPAPAPNEMQQQRKLPKSPRDAFEQGL